MDSLKCPNLQKEVDIPIFSKIPLSDSSNNVREGYKQRIDDKKVSRNFILDMIRKESPIHISKLKEKTGVSYGLLWNIIREFEFVRLVKVREFIDEKKNRQCFVYIPEISEKIQIEQQSGQIKPAPFEPNRKDRGRNE